MIAFGTFVAEDEAYRRYTEPGIARAAEPDSAVLAYASVTSLPRSLNIVLDATARHDDLEALVLMHPHTELTDPGLCDRVRAALADPDVAVAGAAGARGGSGIAWWEGDVAAAPGSLQYDGYGGGGEFPAFGWAGPSAPLGEVDVVDGSLMVLSPWAVRTIHEAYTGWFQRRATSELYAEAPESSLADLAALAGVKVVIDHARGRLAAGEPVRALALAEAAVAAEPDNRAAARLMVEVHEALLAQGGDANFWESGWLHHQIARWRSTGD